MEFKLTLGELITIGSVIASVSTGYAVLKYDVNALKAEVKEIRLEQYRINAVMNFLYGEANKSGWSLTQEQTDQIMAEIEQLKQVK